MTKGILFDYGATIDTGGDHWFHVFYDCARDLGYNFPENIFRWAYICGEKAAAKEAEMLFYFDGVLEELYRKIITAKLQGQVRALLQNGYFAFKSQDYYIANMRNYVYNITWKSVRQSEKVLEILARKYPLGIVSNHYGMLEEVLKEMQIRDLFDVIVDSGKENVRKPDPEIFRRGIEKLSLDPKEVLVVGDSLEKDIIPAASLGCRTAWLRGRGWNDDEEINMIVPRDTVIIQNLNELIEKCAL